MVTPEVAEPTPRPTAPEDSPGRPRGRKRGFAALTLGAVGVVYGDIGTSPIYALREALVHSRPLASPEASVIGVVSLILWTLTLIVTLKYILFLMSADNDGEGGSVALMALAQRALGRPSTAVFILGVAGVALFAGDGVITPAFSVLSAVEGLKAAPHIGHHLAPYVLPTAGGILIALFLIQARGTGRISALFGPIMMLWFLGLASLGLMHVGEAPVIWRAFNPIFAVDFLLANGLAGFVVLGSVFLAVTGAEALYADMGHFGRGPIRVAWALVVFPCLALSYLGQGAFVLAHPRASHNPFFAMIPHAAYWPVLMLATAAAVIASQAVISGVFSMSRQTVQLGLAPRLDIRRTSKTLRGQIFVPAANALMLAGVLVLLVVFQDSHHLASAYGVAVTGTMFASTLLGAVVARARWRWRWDRMAVLVGPILVIDTTFLGANLFKLPEGAWVPLAFGAGLAVVMWTWTRGVGILVAKTRDESVPLADTVARLEARPPAFRQRGAAMFFTSTPDLTPMALLHNLKHNKVLHETNVILTVRTAETPTVPLSERARIEPISRDFRKVTLSYGFMESPNIPKALTLCRKSGLKFDIMATSFFLGRRTVVPATKSAMPLWQDHLFIFLMRNAANPTDFFRIPPGRVVELGAQMTV